MHAFAGIVAVCIICLVLANGFSTIVLARRDETVFRATAAFYHATWKPVAAIGRRIRSGARRETFLSIFGPASLIALIGLWAAGLVIAFGLLQWSAGLRFSASRASLADALVHSGTTLFEVGGTPPLNGWSKLIMVVEAGLGVCFLGLVVGYLPVLYQSYSNRELWTGILDVRAGSPPSATGFFSRQGSSAADVGQQFAGWETWAAELLQHHLSYPMLAYFRSQHINQSWLPSLVTILDASAVAIVCGKPELCAQARATFAVGRHTVADLGRLFRVAPDQTPDRLPPAAFEMLRVEFGAMQSPLDLSRLDPSELSRYRALYEPCAQGLSEHFLMKLPDWIGNESQPDNWVAGGIGEPRGHSAVSDPFSTQESL